jgi:hypothetical protein
MVVYFLGVALPAFISLQLPNREGNIRAQLALTRLSIDLLKELRENRLALPLTEH